MRITDNLRFTVRIVERVFDCNLNLSTGGKNWENFITSVEIRNRVTHPKSMQEFEISNDEIIIVRNVCNWLDDIIVGAINGIIKKLTEIKQPTSKEV